MRLTSYCCSTELPGIVKLKRDETVAVKINEDRKESGETFLFKLTVNFELKNKLSTLGLDQFEIGVYC